MRPKKSFGQNFLINRGIVAKIVTAVAPEPSDHIIEIGPGPGALTRELVAGGARVIAVDLDREMIERLQTELGEAKNLTLVHQDILVFSPPPLSTPGQRYKVVGNIPYNISAPILFWLVKNRANIASAILTMQREVAARVCAPPGGKTYGPLTIGVRAVAHAERLFEIRPHSFWPAPKVHSTTIRLSFPDQPIFPGLDLGRLRELVRRAFMQRRKMLRATLPLNLLAAASIDPTRRPETLAIEEWARLAQQFDYSPSALSSS